MRKISILLIMLFIVGLTGQAIANPVWSDVPAKHWAYAAVKKLSQEGLIEGYPDGTFQGDKTLNRYEFAMLIGKTMDKYDRTNTENQALIDKLSAEFASELNKMGVRLAKVESKTNIWFSGETRMRYAVDNPGSSAIAKLHGSDNFDFRQRLIFRGNISDNATFMGRIATMGSNKFGNTDSTAGSEFALDLMNVTMNNSLGLDKIRLGRMGYALGAGMIICTPWNADGAELTKSFGKVEAKTWSGNIKSNANGDAQQITTFSLSTKLNKNSKLTGGYYWADIPGTSTSTGTGTLNTNVGSFSSSKGWALSYLTKIADWTFMADFVNTTLDNATGIPSNPKGWAVEFSNRKTAPIPYNTIPLTKLEQVGSDAWMIGYRSIDPGTSPSGAQVYNAVMPAYSNQPYNAFTHATDNVKALFLVYNRTIYKNTVLAFEYQDMKFKKTKFTGLGTSQMNKLFVTKLEFFY